MPPKELHCTIRYKSSPGPDREYDEAFHKLGESAITLQHLYISPEGNAMCSVLLNDEQKPKFRMCVPHVSVARNQETEWQNLATVVNRGSRDIYDPAKADKDGFCTGKHDKFLRKTLGWRVRVKPTTHLDEPTFMHERP